MSLVQLPNATRNHVHQQFRQRDHFGGRGEKFGIHKNKTADLKITPGRAVERDPVIRRKERELEARPGSEKSNPSFRRAAAGAVVYCYRKKIKYPSAPSTTTVVINQGRYLGSKSGTGVSESKAGTQCRQR
jgi:hypothetical protein